MEFTGNTPLMDAARKGHLPLVKLLIEHGANPLIRNKKGQLAIDLAQKAGHKAVVDYLR